MPNFSSVAQTAPALAPAPAPKAKTNTYMHTMPFIKLKIRFVIYYHIRGLCYLLLYKQRREDNNESLFFPIATF